jgi:hypothetical protein
VTIDELRAGKRWAELAKALAVEGTVEADVECAEIYRDQLAHRSAEMKAWERVLSRDPDHTAAVNGLELLAVYQADWARLVAIYETRASTAADPRPHLERALAIYRDDLGDKHRAALIEARLAALK